MELAINSFSKNLNQVVDQVVGAAPKAAIRALLASKLVPARIEPRALYGYLRTGSVPEPVAVSSTMGVAAWCASLSFG